MVNLNVLWANPFYLFFIVFLSIRKFTNLVKWYSIINMGLLVALLMAWPLIPQALPWEVYPLVIALTVRFLVIYLNKRI